MSLQPKEKARDGSPGIYTDCEHRSDCGVACRQVPGQPLPDHGKQQYDTDTFHGGCFTAVNPKYFTDTPLKSFRAPDFGDYDVLKEVIPVAKKRGLKTICWFEDRFRRDIPNVS